MAVPLKCVNKFRSWKNEDLFEESDLEGLFEREKVEFTKPVKFTKYWIVYLTLFGFLALFSIGLLTGFLMRVDSKVTNDCSSRSDGFGNLKLQAVHNNIMYFVKASRLSNTFRELHSAFPSGRDSTPANSDIVPAPDKSAISGNDAALNASPAANYVAKKFREYGLDHVEVEETEVVVTYAGADNRLQVIPEVGDRNHSSRGVNLLKGDDPAANSLGLFAVAGSTQGPVVFGKYGSRLDILKIRAANITLKASILFLQLGQTSISEKIHTALNVGCSGLLLFCPSTPCYHSNSLDDAVNFGLEGWNPGIPVQLIPWATALEIFKVSKGTNLFPGAWSKFMQQDDRNSHVFHVHMNVSTTSHTLRNMNVIGTLYGSDETDQEVLVGAELRVDSQSLSNSSFISNVAALLNLAESMTFIRRAEGWRPRRTVKFALWTALGEMSVGIAKYTQRRSFGLHDSTVAYIHLTDEHTGWVTAQSLNWKSSPGFADLVWHASDMVPNPLNKEFSLAEDWIETRDPKVLANDRPLYTYSQNEAPLFQELGISCISLATQLDNMQDDVERGEVTPTLLKLEAQSRVASLVAVRFIDSPILPFNLTHFIQYWSTVIKSTLLAISSSLDPGGSIAKKIERIHSVLDTIVTFSIKDGVHQPSCSTIHSKNNMYKNLESVFERVHDGQFSYGQTGLQVLMKNAIEEFIFTHDQNPVNVMLDTVLECLSRTSEIIESLRFS